MIDERRFRDAMSLFPTGVTVVAADDGVFAHALTVASFASVSLAPPLCLVCIKATSAFLPVARRARMFSVSVLGADQAPLAERFATAPAEERVALLDREAGRAPRVSGALARFDLALDAEHAAGDHRILIGAVEALTAPARDGAPAPLTWWCGRFGLIAPR